ncbi:tetrahydrofolate dehydrogenase/cyclohydrolase catalytic domain-containing protein [Chlamydia gallinacea]|uniref:Bifunctional protein FolD n=2 Tax=Chlamydia gallinacea TaxID=1457153 RepID=A0A173DZY7_9CHLA|nr:tetrahydrofolate dehydrogenase/cyclohydrolase catalytic domain-containing protein [Chlamydia gallinacea]ANG66471.1 bifunctional 5,10-methylene-tetrahydrofolate dehydrogenase/5,10-methylene-tetrahydrofolate cyclohydrolase [Chlamydia gallinacea 08-1274/3]EYE60375.1 tetrahydrofolate dehydrogenase/cyclohydrolase, catalytic domain protein [Bacteroides fragilis str. S6L5]MBX6679800.1 bifunctional 5,10-methylene-tetrahydrofolate dehydrogenase/5,10-methylene-tetrahydrofolate cyclohydrolase [Chlamydia
MLLKGKPIADRICDQLKQKILSSTASPGFASVLIGKDPISEIYAHKKIKHATAMGMTSKLYHLPSDAPLTNILKLIRKLNTDASVHGISIQLPLPKHLDNDTIIQEVSPDKDVEFLHPMNMGKLLLGQLHPYVPCIPGAIIELFNYYDISLQESHVAIMGSSSLVSKPLAAMLMQKHLAISTITIFPTSSKVRADMLKTTDILISAFGIPLFVKEHMLSPHTIVIDAGVSYIEGDHTTKYTPIGDVEFNTVITKCRAISPVLDGIEPVAIAMLMKNIWESYQQSSS